MKKMLVAGIIGLLFWNTLLIHCDASDEGFGEEGTPPSPHPPPSQSSSSDNAPSPKSDTPPSPSPSAPQSQAPAYPPSEPTSNSSSEPSSSSPSETPNMPPSMPPTSSEEMPPPHSSEKMPPPHAHEMPVPPTCEKPTSQTCTCPSPNNLHEIVNNAVTNCLETTKVECIFVKLWNSFFNRRNASNLGVYTVCVLIFLYYIHKIYRQNQTNLEFWLCVAFILFSLTWPLNHMTIQETAKTDFDASAPMTLADTLAKIIGIPLHFKDIWTYTAIVLTTLSWVYSAQIQAGYLAAKPIIIAGYQTVRAWIG